MPRKAKDKVEEENKVSKAKVSKAKTVKKAGTRKEIDEAKVVKKSVAKKESSKPKTTKSSAAKKETAKPKTAKSSVAKKETAKPKTAKKSVTKKDTTKTKSPKKVAAKKDVATKKSGVKKSTKKLITEEYYDLPAKYEQTVVKILAQTPSILFVYWEISSKDKQKLEKQFGEKFFEQTAPYLVVINKEKHYQFEVEINDYANSWYLHIPDSDCKYEVILIRKNKLANIIPENSVSITSSNQMDMPNDHILFEKLGKTVFFKNVKNNSIEEKNISSFAFMHNIGRIYNIYDLYKEMYKNELNGDELGIKLSSSQFSSNFK